MHDKSYSNWLRCQEAQQHNAVDVVSLWTIVNQKFPLPTADEIKVMLKSIMSENSPALQTEKHFGNRLRLHDKQNTYVPWSYKLKLMYGIFNAILVRALHDKTVDLQKNDSLVNFWYKNKRTFQNNYLCYIIRCKCFVIQAGSSRAMRYLGQTRTLKPTLLKIHRNPSACTHHPAQCQLWKYSIVKKSKLERKTYLEINVIPGLKKYCCEVARFWTSTLQCIQLHFCVADDH